MRTIIGPAIYWESLNTNSGVFGPVSDLHDVFPGSSAHSGPPGGRAGDMVILWLASLGVVLTMVVTMIVTQGGILGSHLCLVRSMGHDSDQKTVPWSASFEFRSPNSGIQPISESHFGAQGGRLWPWKSF